MKNLIINMLASGATFGFICGLSWFFEQIIVVESRTYTDFGLVFAKAMAFILMMWIFTVFQSMFESAVVKIEVMKK